MAENPYAAPKAHVEDVQRALPDGDFLPEGPRRAGRQRLALDRRRVGVHGRSNGGRSSACSC